MRWPVIKLVALIGCALLVCKPAHAQDLPADPAAEEPPKVIHVDLPTADKVEEPACKPQRLWGRAEGWLAWIKGASFPALVTVGGTSQLLPGALGQDGTIGRFGGGQITHERLGGRFVLGGWLDDEECLGIELSGSFLASRAVVFGLTSPGTPPIARPFFNVKTQQQDSELVSFPGIVAGSVAVHSGTSLHGTGANLLLSLNSSKDYPLRALVGFRYLDLHDDLDIQENGQVDPSSSAFAGQGIKVHDNFACDNYFYGGNIGLSAAYNIGRLELQVTAQCALGLNQELVNIAGLTHFDAPGGARTVPAGLLAVSSNSGNHLRNRFAVLPEVDLDARFEITSHVFVSAGYSFLYWNRVARAGQQVDTNVNPDLVPTSNSFGQATVLHQPQLSIRDGDFWVHGVHVGLELRF